nr:unnamed protein product [Callosobruchus analis]
MGSHNSTKGHVTYQTIPDPIATVSETDVIMNKERKSKLNNESELKEQKGRWKMQSILYLKYDQNKEEDDCALYAGYCSKLRKIPNGDESLMLEIDSL